MDVLYQSFASGARNAGATIVKVANTVVQQGEAAQRAYLTALLDCLDRSISAPADGAGVEKLLGLVVAGSTAANCSPVFHVIDVSSNDECLCSRTAHRFPVQHVISRMDVKDKVIRQRSCKLLSMIVSAIPDTVDFPDSAWDKIVQSLIARTNDKVPAVRAAACSALARFQDTEGPEVCPAVAALRWVSLHDSSADCRASAVTSLLVARCTLPDLLARVGDAAPSVRAAAVDKVRKGVHCNMLTAHQRRTLLGAGLADPSADVRTCCTLLASVWLGCAGWDVPAWLEGMDFVAEYQGGTAQGEGQELPDTVATAERACEAACTALFAWVEEPTPRAKGGQEQVGSEDSPMVWSAHALYTKTKEVLATYVPAAGECTPESALYWRVRAAWLANAGPVPGPGLGAGPMPARVSPSINPELRAGALDALLPDAATWCGLLSSVCLALGVPVESPGSGLLAGLTPEHMNVGEGEGPGLALRQQALDNGVPTPAALASVPSLPGPDSDPDSPATLHQLLLLGQLLDCGDTVGRRAATAVLCQIIPHPATPGWAVPLAVQALAVVLGAGLPTSALAAPPSSVLAKVKANSPAGGAQATALAGMVPLLAMALGSLQVASAMAATRTSLGPGAGVAGAGAGQYATLQAQVQTLMERLEEAEGQGEDETVIMELQGAIEEAEVALAQLEQDDGGQALGLGALGHGQVPINGSDLAARLKERACWVAVQLMAGSNIAPSILHTQLPGLLDGILPHILPSTATGVSCCAGLAFEHFGAPLLLSSKGNKVALGAQLLSLSAVLYPTRAQGASLSSSYAPTLYMLACDPATPSHARAQVLHACADLAAAYGQRAVSVKSDAVPAGSPTGPLELCGALLHPLSAMALAGEGVGTPLRVQAAAVRMLAQALLTGAIPCTEDAVRSAWPTGVRPGSQAGGGGAPSILAKLFELHHCLMWARGTKVVQEGEEEEGPVAATMAGLLSSLFSAYAALGPVHKSAMLCASLCACARMQAMGVALALDGRAGSFSGVGGGLDAGEDGDEGEDDKENAEEEEVKGKKPAAPKPKAPALGGGKGAKGKDDDGAGSVISTSGAGASGGGMGTSAAWLSAGLHCLLSILTVTPVGKEVEGQGAWTLVPKACMPQAWQGAEEGLGTPAAALVAAWLAVEACAEGRGGSLYLSSLLSALKAIPPPTSGTSSGSGEGVAQALQAQAIAAHALSQELGKMSLKGGVVAERAVKKVGEAWSAGLDGEEGLGAVAQAGELVKAAISGRAAAKKAEVTNVQMEAAAARVSAPSKDGKAGREAAPGLPARTSARTRGTAQVSYAGMDGEGEEED